MLQEYFASQGFAVVPGVLRTRDCDSLAKYLPAPATLPTGSRSLLAQAWCASLARHLRRNVHLAPLIPPSYVAAQCTYFEKSTSHNWLVPVHQDLSIPIAERVPDTTLRGWSEKEGSLFVQAPTTLLERLVAVRLHLDPCTSQDGPLRVIPASHTLGPLSPEAAVSLRTTASEVACHVERGAALVMRPLLVHASSKSTGTSRRRVLHFLFGPKTLPLGLRWSIAV
jgi:Phytanoyl-CoA dioxygenase (PhyH)